MRGHPAGKKSVTLVSRVSLSELERKKTGGNCKASFIWKMAIMLEVMVATAHTRHPYYPP